MALRHRQGGRGAAFFCRLGGALRTISRGSPGRAMLADAAYPPSDQKPFDIAAMALDDRAQVIEVEVGTAQAKLRRVGM